MMFLFSAIQTIENEFRSPQRAGASRAVVFLVDGPASGPDFDIQVG